MQLVMMRSHDGFQINAKLLSNIRYSPKIYNGISLRKNPKFNNYLLSKYYLVTVILIIIRTAPNLRIYQNFPTMTTGFSANAK